MPKCDLNFINKSLKSLRTIRLLFGILNVRVHDVIMTYDSIVALFTSVYSTEQAWYRASRTLRLRIWRWSTQNYTYFWVWAAGSKPLRMPYAMRPP